MSYAAFYGALSAPTVSMSVCDLSDEELDVLASEHDQALAELATAQQELDGLFDRHQQVSNLQSVTHALNARGDKIAGPAYHLAGVAQSNALSVFGEDNAVNECFGEDCGEELDIVQAGEGFAEVITKIWNAIKKGRDKLWRFLKKVAAKAVGKVHRLSRSIEALNKRAENAASKAATESTVEITSGLKSFMLNGKALKSYGEMKKTYADMCGLLGYFNTVYWTDLDKMCVNLDKAVASLKPEEPSIGLTAMIAASEEASGLITKKLVQQVKASSTRAPEKSERIVGAADAEFLVWELLGDKLFVGSRAKAATDRTLVAKSEFVRACRLGVYDYKVKAANVPDSVKMEVMAPATVQEFCAQAQDVLTAIVNVIEKGLRDKIRDKTNKLVQTTDKFVQSAKKVDGIQSADIAVINAVPQHVGKFDSWITQPTMAMENQFVAVTNAIASYASKSLSEYK